MFGSSSTVRPNRREFVKTVTVFLGTLMGTAISLPGIGFIISPAQKVIHEEAWIALGPIDEYPLGIPKPFRFTRPKVNGWEKSVVSYAVYVLRKDEDQVLVVSNICTHLGCRVAWHADLQHYVSPCHNGHFDILGNVLSGPPPRPLDEFPTRMENGNLYIQYPPFKRSNS